MTKRNITIIVSLAVIVVLIAGYFGAQAWIKAHPAAPQWDYSDWPESPRITSFDSSKINRIENFAEGYALLRTDNIWELVSANVPVDKVKLSQGTISGKLWSIANLWAESLIEEDPADLSIYGLDNPIFSLLIGDSDGTTVEIIFGNYTPSRTSLYIMLAGDPAVYTLSTYYADIIYFTLDSIRSKDLFEYLDPAQVIRFIHEPRLADYPSGRTIDIARKTEESVMITNFTNYVMTAPYATVMGAASEKFGEVLESLTEFQIVQYVDDSPASLVSYGLDRPGRVYIETIDETLDILYGTSESGVYFAQRAGDNTVFRLYGLETAVTASPFSLMDKFAMIHSIDNVDSFTVTGDGRTVTATIEGKGNDAIFHLNGRKAADSEFRKFYQTVIGLLIDAEFTGPVTRGEGTDYVIEYKMNTPANTTASIRLIPYNRDFYILEKEGLTQFIIARTQVRRIFDSADAMVYE